MKEVKGETYRVKGVVEETDCNYCGCPLYNGDKAFLSEADGRVYCSKMHAQRSADLKAAQQKVN